MHDPMTVAFEIRRPWPARRTAANGRALPRFYPPILTVWHRDPETDGSDDSCGWSRPRVPQRLRVALDLAAQEEARHPWIQTDARKQPRSAADAECRLRGALLFMARICDVRLPFDRAASLASLLLHHPHDNLRSALCFLPGWHSNREEDREEDRKYHAGRFYYALARIVLDEARPWWRHPRWHFWHWRLQLHPLQDFVRWAFARCSGCGGRFAWGYCPSAIGESVYHHDCADVVGRPVH